MEQSYAIPCEARWEDSIYQLEISDAVRGYDPVTGTDGPANIQARQLGNRTLFLHALLTAEHSEEGHHQLTDDDFTEDTRIPESKLALDHGTDELKEDIHGVEQEVDHTREAADDLDSMTLSMAASLKKLIPLSWEYAGVNNEYELFTADTTLRTFGSTALLSEIAGDESIDVEDTTGIKEGETYYLCDVDGGNVESVTVRSVLTEHRIRCTKALSVTRSEGRFATTTMAVGDGFAEAVSGKFLYISRWMDCLDGADRGTLIICHDRISEELLVEYQLRGSDSWTRAEEQEVRSYHDGKDDHFYDLPTSELRLRVSCNGSQPFKVYFLIVEPVRDVLWIEDIQQPSVVSASVRGAVLTVKGSAYKSLYGIEKFKSAICVSDSSTMDSNLFTAEYASTSDTMTAVLPTALANLKHLFIQLCYTDVEGAVSRWSPVYVM